ncbi:hypothetical protein QYF36_017265 [Acer negundo]|nr:hypothetical protein QYF36_017265 [Acer negundo]
MIVARRPTVTVGSYTLHPHSATIAAGDFKKPLFPLLLSPTYAVCSSIFNSKFSSKASLKCCWTKNDVIQKPIKGFSVLASDCPWKIGSIWSTMALYMFNLHIPLGYGGLSIVASLLEEPVLDPQTQAVSLLVVLMLELGGTLFLLSKNIKPQYDLVDFFKDNKISKERNWLLASALGFGFLSLLVFLTSLIGGRLYGVKVVDNPIVKEILLSSNISKTAFVLVDCAITPVLEEAVYRGFLLTSLASTMKWQHAVILSSAIFSAAHFSIDNFIQLFIIGCVLGCSYCWSGNLTSSIVIHSLYNALILILTFCL